MLRPSLSIGLEYFYFMNYEQFIESIITKRGQWGLSTEQYWEGHHIIPKCLGGSGSTRARHKNIIRLTAEEHFIAHKLLALDYPNNLQIQEAYWHMCNINGKRNYLVTSKEYAEQREKIIKLSGKAVICIETGKVYYSIRAAKVDFPKSGGGISRCCRKLAKRAAGYHWAYLSDIEYQEKLAIYKNIKKPNNSNNKAIICIETQEIFENLKAAIKKYGMGIACCLKRAYSSISYGYHWSYLDDIIRQQQLKDFVNKQRNSSLQAKCRKVCCIELNKIFNSINEASKFCGSKSVYACLIGKCKQAGGYHWKFIEC